jgi:phospholipase C
VEPGKSLSDTWHLGSIGVANCDLSVYGPNGFLRAFKGSVSGLRTAQVDVRTNYDEKTHRITLIITNTSAQPAQVTVLDKYSGKSVDLKIKPADTASPDWSLSHLSGWYDFVITVAADASIEYHFAGHVEDGKDSITDPAISA